MWCATGNFRRHSCRGSGTACTLISVKSKGWILAHARLLPCRLPNHHGHWWGQGTLDGYLHWGLGAYITAGKCFRVCSPVDTFYFLTMGSQAMPFGAVTSTFRNSTSPAMRTCSDGCWDGLYTHWPEPWLVIRAPVCIRICGRQNFVTMETPPSQVESASSP